MSVTPNLCCDETKNRGAYTRLTVVIQIFVYTWKEGRQEEDNPCGLSIIDTGFYVYVSLEILTPSRPFTFFSPGTLCLTLNSLNLFLDCKFVALYIFTLPGRCLTYHGLHLPD